MICKAKKKKIVVLPEVEFLIIRDGQSENIFFLIILFKKHLKVQNLCAFSIFFLQKR